MRESMPDPRTFRRVDSRHGRPLRLRAPPGALLRRDGRGRRAPLRGPGGRLRARRALPVPARSRLPLPDGLRRARRPSPSSTPTRGRSRSSSGRRTARRRRGRAAARAPRAPSSTFGADRAHPVGELAEAPPRPRAQGARPPLGARPQNADGDRLVAGILARFRKEARHADARPGDRVRPDGPPPRDAPREVARGSRPHGARRRDRGRRAPRRAENGPARPLRIRDRGRRGPALPRDGGERAGVPDDRRLRRERDHPPLRRELPAPRRGRPRPRRRGLRGRRLRLGRHADVSRLGPVHAAPEGPLRGRPRRAARRDRRRASRARRGTRRTRRRACPPRRAPRPRPPQGTARDAPEEERGAALRAPPHVRTGWASTSTTGAVPRRRTAARGPSNPEWSSRSSPASTCAPTRRASRRSTSVSASASKTTSS